MRLRRFPGTTPARQGGAAGRVFLFCLLAMTAAGGPSLAAESRRDDLFWRCARLPARAASAACTNYTYGVLTELPFDRSDAALRKHTCFPKVIDPAQARAVVDDYVRNHPERRGASAATLRAEAFNSAFFCN